MRGQKLWQQHKDCISRYSGGYTFCNGASSSPLFGEQVQLVQAKMSSAELTLFLRAVWVTISMCMQNKHILVAFHFTFGLSQKSGSRRTKRRLK